MNDSDCQRGFVLEVGIAWDASQHHPKVEAMKCAVRWYQRSLRLMRLGESLPSVVLIAFSFLVIDGCFLSSYNVRQHEVVCYYKTDLG